MRLVNQLLFILLLVAICIHGYQDYYYAPWFAVTCFMALWVASMIKESYGPLVAVLILYTLVNGLWVWVLKNNRYLPLPPFDQMAIRYFTADSMAKLLIIMAPIMVWVAKDITLARLYGGAAAGLACFVLSCAPIYQFFFKEGFCLPRQSCGGFIGNPSMNAALIACLIPFTADLAKWDKRVTIFIAVVAILLSKSSVGIGLLSAYLALEAIMAGKWHWVLGSSIPLVLGYLSQGWGLFNSSGRIGMWKFFMKNWAINPFHLKYGTGFGTFSPMGRNLQTYLGDAVSNPQGNWPWMHNDWLEFAFVCGIIGAVLMVAVYLSSLWRARIDKPLFLSIILFGVFMALDYPLHLPASCVLGSWLFSCASCRTDKLLRNYF